MNTKKERMTQYNANGNFWASNTVYTGALAEYTAGGGIAISGTGTFSIPKITFSGSNQTALDNHGDGTFATTLSGIWAANQPLTITWSKIGKQITLQFPAVSATQNFAGYINSLLGSELPSYLRPAVDVTIGVPIKDGGTVQATTGKLKIYTDGSLEWNKTFASASFSGAGAGGFEATSVTYITS